MQHVTSSSIFAQGVILFKEDQPDDQLIFRTSTTNNGISQQAI